MFYKSFETFEIGFEKFFIKSNRGKNVIIKT